MCLGPDLALLASCEAFWTLTAGSEECLGTQLRLHQGLVAVAPASLCETVFRCAAPVSLDFHCFCQGSLDSTESRLHLTSVVLAVSARRSLFQPVTPLQILSLGCLSHRPPSLAPTPT